MSQLPYVFTATPEYSAFCGHCEQLKVKGQMIEDTIRDSQLMMKLSVLICAACVTSWDTALTVHSMERDGHAPPPEEDNRETHP
jgi:hypothetical protein